MRFSCVIGDKMQRKNKSVAIAFSAILAFSIIGMMPLVPASAQVTPSITRFEIADTTCQTTGIVGATITSSYFVLMCGSSSSKEIHFQLRSNGNTTQATGALLPSGGANIPLHKVGATDCVVYYRDTTTDVLLKSCVTGTTVTTTTYTPTCASSTPLGSANIFNIPFNSAGDMYFPILCNDGTAEIVRTSTMTLNGIISGFETGAPTCTSVGATQLVTSTRGVMACSGGTAIFLVYSYSLAGGAIAKLGSTNLTGTDHAVATTIISNADGFMESYSPAVTNGGSIDVYRWDLDGTIDPNSPLSTAGDFYQAINGLTGASGNQVQVQTACSPNATGESLYCWSAVGSDPDNPKAFPNNQIINLAIPNGELLFPDAPIGSTGGTTFIIGKGTVNDSLGRYYVATDVVAPQPDLGIPIDGGPQATAPPLIDQLNTFGCLLGLFPVQCEQVCDENGENCEFVPSNIDIKTNGMGYLAFLVIFMIFTGFLLLVLHQSNTGITEVPYYAWIILVVACAGVASQLQFVDSVLFYASIVGGIALPASVGILSRIR